MTTRRRTNGGLSTIDKIRMIAAWAEGAMMQNESNNRLLDEPDENNASSKSTMKLSNLSNLSPRERRAQLHQKLKRAIAAIKENPAEFLKNKDFLDLIAFLKNYRNNGNNGKFRLTVNFPSALLKNKGFLRLLPLPLRIEKRPALANEMAEYMARNFLEKLRRTGSTGIKGVIDPETGDKVLMELDDYVVTFDWFSTDDPRPSKENRETMMLISDFLRTMLSAMGVL